MTDRTLVASATNILATGFLVVPTDRQSRAGEPVNALFAVARAIERVLTFKLPARAIAVVDAAPDLAAWPELLAKQLPALPHLLRTLGFTVVEAADEVHVVASYARAALAAGDDVIVIGRDKRYAQLVGDHLWWYDSNKDVRYTADIVHKRFTVGPAQVADWLALVGDQESLPGVNGLGAKSATSLIETHGSVKAALAVADTIEGRVGKALRAVVDDIPKELARATLDLGRPLTVPLADTRFAPAPVPVRNALYDSLGFAELLVDEGESIRTEVCADANALAALRARVGAGTVAICALIEQPAPVRGELVGIALSAGDAEALYVPRDCAAWPPLAAWLADPAAPKVGHDLLGTLVALRRLGIEVAGIEVTRRARRT